MRTSWCVSHTGYASSLTRNVNFLGVASGFTTGISDFKRQRVSNHRKHFPTYALPYNQPSSLTVYTNFQGLISRANPATCTAQHRASFNQNFSRCTDDVQKG